MRIRGIRPEDINELRAIHQRMGFGYPFPDLAIKDIGMVLVDEQDKPVQAALVVPIGEAYFLMNPDWRGPRERFDAFVDLHEAMRQEVQSRGYAWVQADLPPEVEKSFGRRLLNLGWIKSAWHTYARKVTNG